MKGLNDDPGWCWVGGQVQLVLVEVLAREHRADRAVARVDRDDRGVGMCACRWFGRLTAYGWSAACCAYFCHFGSSVVMIFRPPSNRVRLPRLLALARARRTRRSRCSRIWLDHVAHEEGLVALRDPCRRPPAAPAAARFACAPGSLDPDRSTSAPRATIRSSTSLRRIRPSFGWVERVVVRGPPDHAGERGALGQRQLRRGLLEVELRRRADAVDAVAEVDLVQVQLEDLVLRVLLLDPDRQRQLLELAARSSGRTGRGPGCSSPAAG